VRRGEKLLLRKGKSRWSLRKVTSHLALLKRKRNPGQQIRRRCRGKKGDLEWGEVRPEKSWVVKEALPGEKAHWKEAQSGGGGIPRGGNSTCRGPRILHSREEEREYGWNILKSQKRKWVSLHLSFPGIVSAGPRAEGETAPPRKANANREKEFCQQKTPPTSIRSNFFEGHGNNEVGGKKNETYPRFWAKNCTRVVTLKKDNLFRGPKGRTPTK